jgi:hypothetical protein
MQTEPSQLSGRQQKALVALLEHGVVTRAAEAAKCSYMTLKRWLRQPEFLGEYRKRRQELVEENMALIQKIAQTAVLTLHRAMTCGKSGDEIRAACAILDHAVKAVEFCDVIGRLEAIEKKLARKKP